MSFQVPAGTGSPKHRLSDLHDLKGYPGMTMPSLIEVEAHEFSHPSVADLRLITR
jgi:hypothetical protein